MGLASLPCVVKRATLMALILTLACLQYAWAASSSNATDETCPRMRPGADGTVRIQFHQESVSLPVCSLIGDPCVATTNPDLARLLALLGISMRWSDDRDTLTLYSAAHYVRWKVNSGAGVVDGHDVARDDLLVSTPDGPALSLAGVADLLHLHCEATELEGTYRWQPLIESVAMRDEAGERRIHLRATAPFDCDSDTVGGTLRLVLHDVRWACARDFAFEAAQVHCEGDGSKASPIVVTVQAAEYWRPELYSRLLPTEALVSVVPAFRVAHQFLPQTLSAVRVTEGVNEKEVVAQASGPIQYFWTFNAERRTLTIDIPQAVAASTEPLAVDGGQLEGATVENLHMTSFPVARLTLRLGPGQGFDIRLVEGANSTQLVVRVANDALLPVTTTSGKGFEPPVEGLGCIVLDPGHGGGDPGAINRRLGLQEKDITLDICLRLRAALQAQGWRVLLTRTDDRDLTWPRSPDDLELGARAAVANNAHADLFVSIHCNSGGSGANGSSFHWYKQADRFLACSLSGSLAGQGFANHGPVRNCFYVLRHTRMPAILVETAYISNASDARRLADASVRQHVAEALASALVAYRSRTAALEGQVPTGR